MKVNFIVVSDELADGDVEPTGQGPSVLLDANGVVFDVLTHTQEKENSMESEPCLYSLRG